MGPRTVLDGCGKSRPSLGFDPRIVQPVASRYTDSAIPAPLTTRRFHLIFITSTLLIGLTCNNTFPRTPVGSWCYFCLSGAHAHRMIALCTSVVSLTTRGPLFPAEWGLCVSDAYLWTTFFDSWQDRVVTVGLFVLNGSLVLTRTVLFSVRCEQDF